MYYDVGDGVLGVLRTRATLGWRGWRCGCLFFFSFSSFLGLCMVWWKVERIFWRGAGFWVRTEDRVLGLLGIDCYFSRMLGAPT